MGLSCECCGTELKKGDFIVAYCEKCNDDPDFGTKIEELFKMAKKLAKTLEGRNKIKELRGALREIQYSEVDH